MTLEQEIEMLPVLLLQAMIEHRFFDCTWIKHRKQEIENYIHMNGGISKYDS